MTAKYGTTFPKLGAPAFRALEREGITNLSQLTQYTEEELLSLHGMGPKALGLLRTSLHEQGKSFRK
jgi:DNA-directed RNA polymerase alpha subunit